MTLSFATIRFFAVVRQTLKAGSGDRATQSRLMFSRAVRVKEGSPRLRIEKVPVAAEVT